VVKVLIKTLTAFRLERGKPQKKRKGKERKRAKAVAEFLLYNAAF
jgi:hypothetical protein